MKLRIWAALGAVYLIWGSTYLAIRFAIETMPPFLMGGVRFLIAGAVLFAVRRLLGDKLPSRSEWRSAGIVGLFLLTGGNGCVVFAEQWVPSSLTALLLATTPLWIVLIDWLRPGGHRPTGRALLGVLVGFGGVALLIGPGEIAVGGRMELVGALVVVLGALLWAIGSLYGRGAALPSSPLLGTSMEMLVGGGGLLILGTVAGQWNQFDPAAFSTKSMAAFIYLIVFGAWIAYSAYVWLLKNAPTPLVATYAYVNPVVAIALGSVLAGEAITPRTVLAAAIILGAVVLTTSAPRPEDAARRAINGAKPSQQG
jgi:drug/metabolite transporter (DMT)-like permease